MSDWILTPGQFIKLDEVLWLHIGKSKDGLLDFWSRALGRHQPYHPHELDAFWEAGKLLVLPMTDKPAKKSVLRNVRIPFKYYSEEQQRVMLIREHYVKQYHKDYPHKVGKSPNSVKNWLKGIEPPAVPHTPDERLSKWTVPRAYKDWIAGGRCIEALSHGNAFGTHESTLKPVRHIIEATIEQFHVPYAKLDVDDLLGIINREIEQAQKTGEVPTHDENGNELDFLPCRQTIYNYVDKLSGWEKRRIREGIDEANREHSTRGRKPRVQYPFQEWQGDHKLIPWQTHISIRDEFGQVHDVVMGAVWMTCIIDVATKYVYPPAVGVDAPSTARSMEATRTALCPRTEYFERMGLVGQYDPPAVIPEMIFLDNQADNHGDNQDAMMRDLDIENGFAGAYRGDHKEAIEEFNSKVEDWARKFPGVLPKAKDMKRGKRPRKFPVVPLSIEDIRREIAQFVATYNDTPQKALGGISPNEAMRRGVAKIEDARENGMPLPLRPTMEKSVDDLDRIFSIRATAIVRDYGVRHLYLEWTTDDFQDRLGHKVEIRINFRDVFTPWIIDDVDKKWIKGLGSWPLYMQGLPWTEHRLIRARVLRHEASLAAKTGKRSTLDFHRRYMANKCEGLKRLFELAGKFFKLNLAKKRNDRLWKDARPVGHLDFAILSTTASAVDVHEQRIPPGMEKVFKLTKQGGILVPIPIEKPPKNDPAYMDIDDDQAIEPVDLTDGPLARGDGSVSV